MMRLTGFVLLLFTCLFATAQENSPYSRYGLGDLVPNQNIINRGMGGISAGYSDYRNVNTVNPASYGNLNFYSLFDFGAEVDTRTLKSTNPIGKFSTTNLNVSYVQVGLPVKMKKANKKGVFLGLDFGLRPVSRVNYKIMSSERKVGIDSLSTIYEGSGGLSEAMVGAGLRIKNFNIGFNSGYRFGNKTYSTRIAFINDTVSYYQSNSTSEAHYGGLFFTGGAQYEIQLKKHNKKAGLLRLGAYGSLSQSMSGTRNTLRQTVTYDADGAPFQVDSVYHVEEDGKVKMPLSWGAGFTYQDSGSHWLFGADYEEMNWSEYRFFDQKDLVQNAWTIRAGAEYLPASAQTSVKKYFSFVKYRAGFYYGHDYVNTANTTIPEYGFTLGASFPFKIRQKSAFDSPRFSFLNTAIEIGSRGNKQTNLRESILRISVGFSLGDLWFNTSKYY